MKKVLIIGTSSKTRGGITSVIKALQNTNCWKKYHCRWIQTHRDGNIIRKLWYLFSAIIEYIMLLPFYDSVHIHFSATTSARRKYIFFKIAKFFHKKIIIHLHCGTQINDIWNPVYRKMFLNADQCLVLSKSIKKIIENYIGQNNKIKILYNPCPIIKRDLISEKQNNILFAGAIISDKGYSDLIKAFAPVTKKFPDWRLVFAGNGEIETGKKMAETLNISSQVIFKGWISGKEKELVFSSASIFCLPSYAEGFPMAVLEAWAYGLPVITTPVGGLPDVLEHGVNAMVFNPGDIQSLSKNLEYLIQDEQLRKNLSLQSLHLSQTRFNINTIQKEMDQLYASVLGEKTSYFHTQANQTKINFS